MHNVEIRDIADFSHWLPTISSWFYSEWRELYGSQTQGDVERRIGGWLQRDAIPTALVAVIDDQVVGTVALKEKELEQFPGAPWLAGLFVVPQYRNCGIGARLLRAAEDKARTLGLRKLYLYTPNSRRYYDTLGWRLQQEVELGSGSVAVMEKVLVPHSLFQQPPQRQRG